MTGASLTRRVWVRAARSVDGSSARGGGGVAMDADGAVRTAGDVAELTGLLNLSSWPDRMRVIVRREWSHPGAQLSIFEESDAPRRAAPKGDLSIPSL